MNVTLAVATAAVLGALSLGDVVQAVGFAALLVTFLAVGRGRNKDATIKTWRENAEAEMARADRLEGELDGAQGRADSEHDRRIDAEQRAAGLEGQIKELRPYGEAFHALTDALTRIESVIGTAIQEQGELVLKNTEIASGSVKILEQVAKDLDRLTRRLEGTP